MVVGVGVLVLVGGFGCGFVRNWCWLDRIVLRRLGHVRLLGLLLLKMLIGFGSWLRLRPVLCG